MRRKKLLVKERGPQVKPGLPDASLSARVGQGAGLGVQLSARYSMHGFELLAEWGDGD
jgi:hypothetical protein